MKYAENDRIEVRTPDGWKPGTFIGMIRGAYVVECPAIWYGPLSGVSPDDIRPAPEAAAP